MRHAGTFSPAMSDTAAYSSVEGPDDQPLLKLAATGSSKNVLVVGERWMEKKVVIPLLPLVLLLLIYVLQTFLTTAVALALALAKTPHCSCPDLPPGRDVMQTSAEVGNAGTGFVEDVKEDVEGKAGTAKGASGEGVSGWPTADDTCDMGGIFSKGGLLKGKKDSGSKTKKAQTLPHLYGIQRSLLPGNFTPFAEILCRSKSDKRKHFLGHMYGEYLDPLRLQQESVKMLEIGRPHAHSLRLWLSAFPRGCIYALDAVAFNASAVVREAEAARRVVALQGDQENMTRLSEIFWKVKKEVGYLDFIVDDGRHTMGQQMTSFSFLFPLVRPGGFYFIEDLQTSYWKKKCHRKPYIGKPYCYGGGPPGSSNTTTSLLKSLVDVLNSDFIEDHANVEKLGSGVYHVNRVDSLVGSVQCWRNMCVVRRRFSGSYF